MLPRYRAPEDPMAGRYLLQETRLVRSLQYPSPSGRACAVKAVRYPGPEKPNTNARVPLPDAGMPLTLPLAAPRIIILPGKGHAGDRSGTY